MEHCQCQPNPGEAMETTFALYHNLVLFLLTHVSQDAAWQVLRRLVFAPHSSEANRTPGAAAPFGDGMPSSAAQFVDGTLGSAAQFGDVTPSSAMVVQILEMAKCLPAEFYCCTVKLVTKQVYKTCSSRRVGLCMQVRICFVFVESGLLSRRHVECSIAVVTKLPV